MTRILACATLAVGIVFAVPVVGSDPVIYFSGDQTRAFAAGRPLTETDAYKVHASRREKPGQAEVHDRDTDIIYVLDGTATLVTGGTAVDAETTAPDERRGGSISGGTTRRLAKGDVVVVPHGTAHQFTEVQAPFLYYVVKVTTGGGR